MSISVRSVLHGALFATLLIGVGSAVGADAFRPLDALGPPPIPDDNPMSEEKTELGKLLYFDPRVSGDATTPCAGCHIPTAGWAFPTDVCRGYPGTSHWRNCQTVVNTAYYGKLFWAGSSRSLEAQAKSAAKGAVGGNGETDIMEARLRQIPEYVKRFKTVFGTELPEMKDAWYAIAAYERSLVQRDTPFDKYMLGDTSALTDAQVRGKEVFEGKAGCIGCHDGAFFTNERYYNIGVPENETFATDPLRQITFRFEQYAKGVPEDLYRKTKTDLGLFYTTKRHTDMGKFRVPTLRYLTPTAPYMHNGTIKTLADVVDFYDAGGGPDPIAAGFGADAGTKTDLIQPLGLSAEEKADLVAFLESLTGELIVESAPDLPPYAAATRTDPGSH